MCVCACVRACVRACARVRACVCEHSHMIIFVFVVRHTEHLVTKVRMGIKIRKRFKCSYMPRYPSTTQDTDISHGSKMI